MKPLSSAYFTLILPIIVLVLLAAGCRREADPELQRADALMEQHPDSAFAILSAIDPVSLGGDKPYYALLMTQAQVKAGETVLSDSLIRIAYSHYGDHGSGDRSVRASFYVGEVAFNRGDNRTAMLYYLAALEEARNTGDSYWQGKAAQRMADLFFGACNYDEAERYHGMAAESFGMAGRTDNRRYALADLATVCLNNHKEDRAAQLLDSLYAVCASDVPVDSFLLRYVRRPMIDAYLATGRLGEITEKDIEMLWNPFSQVQMADNAILLNKLQSARLDVVTDNGIHDYMDSLGYSNETKALLLYELYRDAKSRGDDSKALAYTDTLICLQSEVTEDILKQSMTGAQRDYYIQKIAYERLQAEHQRSLLIIGIAVLVVLMCLMAAFFRMKGLRDSALIESKVNAILDLQKEKESLKTRLSDNDGRIAELTKAVSGQNTELRQKVDETQTKMRERERVHGEILESLFKDSWKHLDMLLDEYYKNDGTSGSNNTSWKNIEREIKKVCSDKNVESIVESVDTYMGGIVTLLKTELPELKNADVIFLALQFAGFSTHSVCALTGINQGNFYTRRKRLRLRIENSGAVHKTDFLARF